MHFLGASDRVGCGFRQAEETDLAGLDKSGHRPNRVLDRRISINPVLVEKIDQIPT